jgi:hypothetical protein
LQEGISRTLLSYNKAQDEEFSTLVLMLDKRKVTLANGFLSPPGTDLVINTRIFDWEMTFLVLERNVPNPLNLRRLEALACSWLDFG